MFPLGTVLFPHIGLPLRIFEPRYRELTRRCLNDDRRFGIVLIVSGSEVGGGDTRFDVGTIAEIIAAEVADDGQAQLVVVGRERFRVERWLDGELYPLAEVSYFEENNETMTASLVTAIDDATKRTRRLLATRSEFEIPGPPATVELDDDPSVRLWQLCALLPVESHDDLALLASPTSSSRVELLGRLLDQVDENTNRLFPQA